MEFLALEQSVECSQDQSILGVEYQTTPEARHGRHRSSRRGELEDSRVTAPRSLSTPGSLPCVILGWSQTVACAIAFMEAHQLGLHDFDKSRLIRK